METLEKQKAELRKKLREKMCLLSDDEKAALDHELCVQVMKLLEIRDADCVYAYASLKREAGTWDIIKSVLAEGKKLALPRVIGEEMRFYYAADLSDLETGAYGILEPRNTCREAGDMDSVMLVPGMAFTADGKRLGKGGGYYDRFLSKEPCHHTVGLAYDFQILPDLPAGPSDRKVLRIVTPEKIISCEHD